MARTSNFVNLTGGPQMIAELNRQVAAIKERSKAGMNAACVLVLGTAIPRTPAKEGNLRRSAYKDVRETTNGIVGEIGYTAYYAPYVHEIPRMHYTTPGTNWKFLETALMDKSGEILGVLRGEIQIKPGDTRNVFRGVTRASARRKIYGSEGSF